MNKKLLLSLVLLVVMVTMAACSPAAAPAATQTVALPAPSETTLPTDTVVPTFTSTVTSSPLPTLTFTPTITFTATAGVANFQVYSVGQQANGMAIYFKIPGLKEAYKVVIDSNKDYSCFLDERYPERLFCYGPNIQLDENLPISFYPMGSNEAVYTGTINIPKAIFSTPLPVGAARTWCPQRGEHVTCETENRLNLQGEPCIVSTCFDLCGYYYSINTCPDTPGPN